MTPGATPFGGIPCRIRCMSHTRPAPTAIGRYSTLRRIITTTTRAITTTIT